MGFTWTASKSQVLRELERTLSQPSKILTACSKAMAEESVNLAGECFEAQADPYGRPWRPVVSPRKSGSAILVDTGSLRDSFSVKRATRNGFTILAGVFYAVFHQSGTKHMVARKMLPDGRGIPAKWRARYREVVRATLDSFFKR